jgi:hypothetical protein
MDPRCKVLLVMGKNDANNPDPYRQQSVLIVPLPHPGVRVIRHTKVMGYDAFPSLNPTDFRMRPMATQKLYSTMFVSQKRTLFSEKDVDSK